MGVAVVWRLLELLPFGPHFGPGAASLLSLGLLTQDRL
jgi:hypothetical protein